MEVVTDWLSAQLDLRHAVGGWVLSSILLYVIGVWLVWLWERDYVTFPPSLRPWRTPLFEGARLAHLILPAYLALVTGVAAAPALGLTELDWISNLGLGGSYLVISLLLLGGGLLTYWRALSTVLANQKPPITTTRPLPLLLLGAGGLQLQWALYRAAATEWLGGDAYWGLWLGCGLVILQWTLNPAWWRAIHTPGKAEIVLLRAALLPITGVLVFIALNLWMAVAVHILAVLLLLPPRPRASEQA